MSATIKQIAELAGVSIGTVDRALNNRGRVRPEVEQRIKKIAEALDYRPNTIARILSVKNKNLKIAVILHIQKNLFFDSVIRGIQLAADEIADYGISVEIKRGAHFDARYQLRLIDEAIAGGASAIAIVPINAPEIKDKLRQLHGSGMPVFLLSNILEDTPFCEYVGCDYRQAGSITAGLLDIISGKEDRILVFSPPFQMQGHVYRVEGIKAHKGLAAKGILKGVYELSENDIDNYNLTKQAFLEHPGASILVTSGAVIDDGVFQALKEMGLYGKIRILVHDLSEATLEGLRDGSIVASIDQSPEEQGYRLIHGVSDYFVYSLDSCMKNSYVKTQIILRESLLAREDPRL